MNDGAPVKVVYEDHGDRGLRDFYTTRFRIGNVVFYSTVDAKPARGDSRKLNEMRMAEDFAQLRAHGVDPDTIDWESIGDA